MTAATPDNMQARDGMDRTLQRWREEGLIRSGWTLDWDHSAGAWKTTFQMRGCATQHTLTEAQFEMYLLGFTERSIAIRHRRPLADDRQPTQRKNARV